MTENQNKQKKGETEEEYDWCIEQTILSDGKPWDFNCREKLKKAIKLVRERKAMLLICSPMCTAFSKLQNLNFRK